MYKWHKKIRFSIVLMLLSVLLTSSFLLYSNILPSYSFADTIGKVANTNGYSINVRDGAGTENQILYRLHQDDELTILGEAYDDEGDMWYQISTPQGEGYMHSAFVTLEAEPEEQPQDETTDESTDQATVETDDTTTQEGNTITDDMTVQDDTTPQEYRTNVINEDEFEAYLDTQQFPESYREPLRQLHAKYPKWRFVALHTGLDWNEVVYKQTHPVSNNLVSSGIYESWKSTEPQAYNPVTGQYTVFDSGGWVAASEDIVKHYLDPRSSLDEVTIFQFLSNTYDSSTQNITSLNNVIGASFLSKPFPESTYSSYASLIMAAASENNVNPLTIASMIINEQGYNGTSSSISGTVSGYEGYYNYFNIGAYAAGGNSAIINGLIYAKNHGWNSRTASIRGGAAWYSNNYVNANKFNLYLQKFNVMNGIDAVATGQYMTAVWGANSEGISLSKGYKNMLSSGITFSIPVYENMPADPCDPPWSGNNIKYLKSLSVGNFSLTPTFDTYTTDYELVVPNSVSSINVSASAFASDATVSGTGNKSLSVGENTIEVTCTSSSGKSFTYTISVTRREGSGDDDNPDSEVSPSSTSYTLGDYLTGLSPDTSYSSFLSKFNKGTGSVKVFSSSGSEVTSGIINSGMICKTYDSNGNVIKSMDIVLKGDINMDGKVNIIDAVYILNYSVGKTSLSGVAKKAADVDASATVNIVDAVTILNHTVGLKKIIF